MGNLQVWAPNAKSVELVNKDRVSFQPALVLQPTKVSYRGEKMSGYWELAPAQGQAFPLNDGDGYWFKITFKSGEVRYRVDPYSRAMNHSESYSIYKDPARFAWTDAEHQTPSRGRMVIYQLFQGGYVGRGDQNWKDPAGNAYHFTWNSTKKGDFK